MLLLQDLPNDANDVFSATFYYQLSVAFLFISKTGNLTMILWDFLTFRKEKQRQAYIDSQCGFCGCVALSEPSNYSFALTSMSFRDLPLL